MEGSNNAGGRLRHFRLSLFVCLSVIITSITIAAHENNQKPSEANSTKRKSSGPYCGLYCLYTTIKLAGQVANFQELVKPEYIGSRKGSSLAELKKAGEDYGLYAIPVGKLTSRELINSPCPIILHVKSSLERQEYDHYELFLGTENGKAKLFDPPQPVRLVPFSELAPRWDGNGLIVAAEPIDLGVVFAPARKRFLVYAAVAVAIVLTVHLVRRRWMASTRIGSRLRLGFSITQCAGFAIAALLCGMIYHFANNEGLLANANATASIQQVHQGSFIPKLSEKKVRKLLDTDTVFIDARRARDFKAGHLKGAISVPVDANDVEYQKTTTNIAKNAHIVLYCQSAGCKFAEIVAIKLKNEGFPNISIFRGGWNEWVAKNGKPKEVSL